MPKVNVYLPDELAEAVRAAGIPVSSVCQRALEEAVREVRSAKIAPGITPTLERFTNRARTVVSLAAGFAQADDVDLGSEHILRGLIAEGEGVGARALGALGVTAESLAAPLAERASIADGNDVYRQCLNEALKLGHNYIGTEHMLLAIAAADGSTARQALSELGVTASALQRQVISILTSIGVPAPAATAPTVAGDLAGKLDDVVRRLEQLEKRLPK